MSAYAFSDIHGCYDILQHILDYCKTDDKIYFLGDAIDRGDYSIDCVEKLRDDPRVIYLKGNHEELACQAIPTWVGFGHNKRAIEIWEANGGMSTMTQLECEYSLEEIKDFYQYWDRLPTGVTYVTSKGDEIILEHAGHTPWIASYKHHDPLWDREHFQDDYFKEGEHIYVVHGHTPGEALEYYYGYKDQEERDHIRETVYLRGEDTGWRPSVIRYCSGHKFDIDLGTFYTGVAALLDLDTFEVIYFDKDGIINNGR